MAERTKITSGLRFTLTAVYTVVFTLLLIGVSLLFRQTLASNLTQNARDDLDQNWAIVKGYLRVVNDPGETNFHPQWYNDRSDPDETSTVAAVRNLIFIADANGHVLESSANYNALGTDRPADINAVLASRQAVWRNKYDSHGTPYLIRASYINGEDSPDRKFYVAIGLSQAASTKLLNQFTLLILGLIPLVILTGGAMGWIFAGRALTPVIEVAQTAQRIGGSNLSLRIPVRGSGDELDRLIETFNEMIGRLEVSFNQARQFSTDVSHELRTPITVVRGQLEVALFTAESVEQYREAIVNSLADIERLSQIVRALLLLSQAETGQVVLQRQSLDLIETIEDVVEQFQIPAEGADVKLKFVCNVARCTGDFDRVQIERMLSNLLSNAIKFTLAGGSVKVSLERLGGEAEIRVEDTGKGISAEHLPHIFDRFYRVRTGEEATPEKGLGLGLSFVSWIVRAHGGTVEVESQSGKGTTFVVRLPLGVTGPMATNEAPTPELMKPV